MRRPLRTLGRVVLAAALLLVVDSAPVLSNQGVVRISDVRVAGVRSVPESLVLAWLQLRPGTVWSLRSERLAIDRVLDGYRGRGYWNAEVERVGSVGSGVAGLSYRVHEGRRTKVGRVTYAHDDVSDASYTALTHVVSGDPLIVERLEEDAEALMAYLERTGYPFAQISPEIEVAPGDSLVDVSWVIDRGNRVTVDGVRFSGHRVTRTDVMLRETRLEIGQPYDLVSVDEATRSLRRLPFLRGVMDPMIEQDARTGRYVLHYQVEEEAASQVEGAAGLLPDGSGSYDWVGRFHFLSNNLTGSGRGGEFLWSRPDRASTDLRIAYTEPWFLGAPFDGTVALDYQVRPGFVEIGLQLGGAYKPTSDLVVALQMGRRNVRPDSVGVLAQSRQDVWSMAARTVWDRRESRRFGAHGASVSGALALDRVSNDDLNTSFSRLRYQGQGAAYLGLSRQNTAGLRLNTEGLIQDTNPAPSDLVRLGGARTVRGYLEEHFLATHAVWANAELIQHLGRWTRAYLFTDGGLLQIPGATEDRWEQAVGYGFGLQATTPSGLMTIEYGLSKDDSPGEGKIHVRLQNTF